MDAVILAAGKGTRLAGIAAPYHKPLLVMNGEALVARAARQAYENGCSRVVVVAAPENALVLSQILPPDVLMIVQRQPTGPGNALLLGLGLVREGKVLILMGDNYSQNVDVQRIVEYEGACNVVGTRNMPAGDVERYTYLNHSDTWVEKVSPVGSGYFNAWVGPLRLVRSDATAALGLTAFTEGNELPIGPAFNHLKIRLALCPVATIDIGTPETLS